MRYTEIINEAKAPADELFNKLVSEYNNKQDGELDYSVYKTNIGNIVVSWTITFRRNTRLGAFNQYQSYVRRGNHTLEQIAAENPGLLISKKLPTGKADPDSDDEYSEYEQAIGGHIVLKNTTPVARSKDGRKFQPLMAERLTKKYNGKKIHNIVFSVEQKGDAVIELKWKLLFHDMKYGPAITKYREDIDKAENMMKEALYKYIDQALDIRLLDEKDQRNLDRYIMQHEVKGPHTMSSSIKFCLVLPTKENGYGEYIGRNNQMKAAHKSTGDSQ